MTGMDSARAVQTRANLDLARRALAMLLAAVTVAALATPMSLAAAEETVKVGAYYHARREWTRTEVRNTFDLWVRELNDRFQVPVRFLHYDDLAELRRDFVAGKLDAINTDAMTFVRHFPPEELAEGYATIMKGGWDLQLYAATGSVFLDMADLAGKRVVVLDENEAGDIYLETLCLRHHERPCAAVFAEIQRVSTNNQALMRLHFGKADLALVHGYGYDLAVELNPQLAKAVRRVAERPINSIFFAFFSKRVEKPLRQRILRVIPGMHDYPRGRQLLDIFKMERLVLAVPGDLKPFYQIDQEHRELVAKTKGRRK